ncbi:protein KASH5-like [Huso huso]|uniref:Protein KASH5-like n=1 Tax=Huso huso TaxID=61971 RepID=A0ABR0Y2F5_HUSHU
MWKTWTWSVRERRNRSVEDLDWSCAFGEVEESLIKGSAVLLSKPDPEPAEAVSVIKAPQPQLDSSSGDIESGQSYMDESLDSEPEGWVSADQIVEYLQAVTGQPRDEGPLRVLHRVLDPEQSGQAVDQNTFLCVMKGWVAEVREDGSEMRGSDEVEFIETVSLLHPGKKTGGSTAQLEGYGGDTSRVTVEPADLLSSIEGLEFTNRRLIERNETLQRAVEGSEETSSHLNEEISLLQQQLRISQHALQQARSVSEELEELKGAAKALEETNSHMRRHTKQLEREQQAMTVETRCRQEEVKQKTHTFITFK